ncbi:hypothetical protein ACLOJK_013604 [Asimina triloba]
MCTLSFRLAPSPAPNLIAEEAYALLSSLPYSLPRLNRLAPHFTQEAAAHLLLKTQSDKNLTLKFLHWARCQPFFSLSPHPKSLAIHILTRFKLFNSAQNLALDLIADDPPAVPAAFHSLKSTFHLSRSSSSSVFDLLIKSYASANLVHKALAALHLSKDSGFMPSVLAYNSILDAVFRSLNGSDPTAVAQGLYAEMIGSGVSLNVFSYNILIRGFCENGNLEKALGLFDQMEENGCLPNVVTVNTLINGYCKLGKIDDAFGVFLSMAGRQLQPNLVTYNAILNGLCREGRMKETSAIVDEMINNRLMPDKVTYNTLVNGYCRQGNIHQALVLHAEMIQKGLPPNVVTYTSLISSMCRDGNLHRALEFLGQMRERGLRPNEITYTTLIDGFTKQGFMIDAYAVLKEMEEAGFSPSIVTYNSIVNGHCLLGRIDEAMGTIHDMEAKGLVPDVVTYCSIVSGYCRNGDLEKAFSVNQEMIDKGVSPDAATYSSLIQGLCEQKRLSDALNLFEKMLSLGFQPDEFTYTTLIDGYCKEGDVSKALCLHDEMLQRGILPDVVTYNVLINGLSKKARTREAKRLLFKLYYEDSVPEDITYGTLMSHCNNTQFKNVVALLKGFCMKGLMDEADRVFEMIVKNWEPGNAVYNIMMHGHCRGGNVRKALDLYKKMASASFVPNTASVIALMKRLYNEGMGTELSQVIQDILRGCLLTDAEISKVLVEVNLKEGNIEAVFSVLSEMAKDGLLPNSGKTAISER